MYFEHAAMARHMLDVARTHGADPARVLGEAQVDPVLIEAPALHVPWPAMQRMLKAAARLTGKSAFGLQAASAGDFSLLDMAGPYMLNQRTLGDALHIVWGEIQPRATNLFRNEIHLGDGAVSVRLHRAPADPDQLDQTIEYYLLVSIRAFRLVLGPDWMPHRVTFRHGPSSGVDEYRRMLGFAPEFQQPRDELVIDRKLLDFQFPLADAKLLKFIAPDYRAYLSALENDLAVTLWARQTLHSAIGDGGALRLTEIAERMRMPPRTLQHKLGQERTTFAEVRDTVRRDVAARELAAPQANLDALALKLDFSDTTAFVRAFRRWTGTTPGQWRAKS